MEFANFNNLRGVKFCHRVRFSSKHPFWVNTRSVCVPTSAFLPTLFNHVRHIARMSSNEKVRDITARWSVAGMEDMETILNFAVRQYPCNPMGEEFAFSTDGKSPIALNSPGHPGPALIFRPLFNFLPKTSLILICKLGQLFGNHISSLYLTCFARNAIPFL